MLMEMYMYDGIKVQTIPIIDAHVSNVDEMAKAIQLSYINYVDSFSTEEEIVFRNFSKWMGSSKKRKFVYGTTDQVRAKRSVLSGADVAEMVRLRALSDTEFESDFSTTIMNIVKEQCVHKVVMMCATLPWLKDIKDFRYKNLLLYHVYLGVYLKHKLEAVWKQIRDVVMTNYTSDTDLDPIKNNVWFFDYLKSKNDILARVYGVLLRYEDLLLEYIRADTFLPGQNIVSDQMTEQVKNIRDLVKGTVYEFTSTLVHDAITHPDNIDVYIRTRDIMTFLSNCERVMYSRMDSFFRTIKGGEKDFKDINQIFKELTELNQSIVSHLLFSLTTATISDDWLDTFLNYIFLKRMLRTYRYTVYDKFRAKYPHAKDVTVLTATIKQIPPNLNYTVEREGGTFFVEINKLLKEGFTGLMKYRQVKLYFQTHWWDSLGPVVDYEKTIKLLILRYREYERGKEGTLPPKPKLPAHLLIPIASPSPPVSTSPDDKEVRVPTAGESVLSHQSRSPPPTNLDRVPTGSTPQLSRSTKPQPGDDYNISTMSVEESTYTVEHRELSEDDDVDNNDDESDSVLLQDNEKHDIYIKPAFYGVLLSDIGTTVETRSGTPPDRLELQVSVNSEGKLEFKFVSNIYDFAMSPTLLKAVGFDKNASKYMLSALNTRIMLKNCLRLDGDDTQKRMDSFHASISTNSKRLGVDKYFLKENTTSRNRHYVEAGINREEFLRVLHNKIAEDGITLEYFVKNILFSKKEYIAFVANVAKRKQISLLDIVVYRLMSELQTGIFSMPDVVNVNPSDMVFVYTNIIVPEDVDNTRLRVLEVMSLRPRSGDSKIEQIEFSNTHYKKLDIEVLDDIEFLIATSLGTPVPFRYGPATIQLHFRRR
jgi:hypothetical protein